MDRLTPRQIAELILSQESAPDPRAPPFEQLVALARAVVAPMRIKLGTEPVLYVSQAAARSFAAFLDESSPAPTTPEEARRQLVDLLIDATPSDEPDVWRVRGRERGLDVTAITAREGRRIVVVSISRPRLVRPSRR